MDDVVKKFIKDNSLIIQTNKWNEFFHNWYKQCAKIWPADKEEKELFTILTASGVSVDWNARKEVIIENVKEVIIEVLDNSEPWIGNKIGYGYLENELTTFLGYTASEIDEFIYDCAMQMGLKDEQTHFTFER